MDLKDNLEIDTSSEVNSTPGIQLNDPEEFLGEADECIAMTVVVGALSGQARALLIETVTQDAGPHPMTGNVIDVFAVGDVTEAFGDFTGLVLHTTVRPPLPENLFHDGFESGDSPTWASEVP